MTPILQDKTSTDLMHFQKSDTTSNFYWKTVIFMLYKRCHYVNWTELFLQKLNGTIFLDSTSLLIIKLWKRYSFWIRPRNEHTSRKHFSNKNKINIQKSANGGFLLRKSGIRRYCATSYRELFSVFLRPPMCIPCSEISDKCSARSGRTKSVNFKWPKVWSRKMESL